MPGMGGWRPRGLSIPAPAVRVLAVTLERRAGQRLLRGGPRVGRTSRVTNWKRACCAAACRWWRGARSANPFDALTGREMQICSLMLTGQRPADIAARLFITAKTVHTFRYRIYEKLGIKGDLELARLATSHGLIGINP
jgi:DNA-binding CsgD family transcriptional regulator